MRSCGGACARPRPRSAPRTSSPTTAAAAIIDDHIPFLLAGVPAIDLIDFDYEYADTVQDTPDKLDPAALDAVGETVAELVLQLATQD